MLILPVCDSVVIKQIVNKTINKWIKFIFIINIYDIDYYCIYDCFIFKINDQKGCQDPLRMCLMFKILVSSCFSHY